jgi:hypothetical protein
MEKIPRVFVSMGTPYREDYVQFRDALERLLRDQCRVDPRIIGKNEYPSGTPIQHINDTIKSCDGVIIVAYERKLIEKGVEKPGANLAYHNTTELKNEKFTTPWNHIESAIAYALGLPLYIIAQRGLTEEGLIESKADWYVLKIDFTEQSLRDPHVFESISSWLRERVMKTSRQRRRPLENFMKVSISELTLEEWLILGGIIGSAFLAGVGAARWIPGWVAEPAKQAVAQLFQ